MALFGFGMKKHFPSPPEEKKTDTPEIHGPSDQYLIHVNGMWMVNPDYDPSTIKPNTQVKTSSVWSESIDNYLARNENAKLVKLTGKPEDLASYEVGNRCKVQQDDDDDEKYNVLCGGDIIGRLPASAITYADKHDCPPDDLAVIIAEVDYDIEKERNIISVYISD